MRAVRHTSTALVPESTAGTWQAPPGTSFGAQSPGTTGITLWKGFQRDYAEGLELLERNAGSAGMTP